MPSVIFINGLNDTNTVNVRRISPRNFEYSIEGTQEIASDIELEDFKKRVITLGGEQRTRFQIGHPDLFFNCICDPDNNGRTLALARRMLRGTDIPVLNHPARVQETTRDNVYRACKDIPGVTVPKVLRMAPRRIDEIVEVVERGEITLPLIMRPVGTHGGQGVYRLESLNDADELQRFAFDGTEYYLIEFVDFGDADGMYRKYRFMIVDGKPYARHLIISDHWNVHAESRKRVMSVNEDYLREEGSFLDLFQYSPPAHIAKALKNIHTALQLEYFGVDCNVRPDGQVVVFEVNACVNALKQSDLKQFPYLGRAIKLIKTALTDMIQQRVTANV